MTTKRLYGLLILMNVLVLGVVFAHFYRSGAISAMHRDHASFFDTYKALFGLSPFVATLLYLLFNYFLGFRPRRGPSTIDDTEIEG